MKFLRGKIFNSSMFVILNLALLSGILGISTKAEETYDLLNAEDMLELNDGAILFADDYKIEKESPMSHGNIIELENSYSPRIIECPIDEKIEEAAKISQNELAYTRKRRSKIDDALLKFFKRTIGEDLMDLNDFVDNKKLNIGLSFSGGGYRSLFTGAGQLLGLDDRLGEKYPLSGILQASTYITGTNEGNWLIGALIAYGFPIVTELFDSPDIFNFKDDLITPYGEDMHRNKEYWNRISKEIGEKYDAGFPVSPVDILGRALSFQLLDKKRNENLNSFTLSDIADLKAFKSADMPYPLMIANCAFAERNGFDSYEYFNFPLEMNPHRITIWEPSIAKSFSTSYFGSYTNGKTEVCIDRFDNLAFLMGAASSTSTRFIKDLYIPSGDSPVNYKKTELDKSLFELDIKDEKLNLLSNSSYFKLDKNSFNYKDLYTTSYDESKIGISLNSLVLPEREVDVIFLFDNTGDDIRNLPNLEAVDQAIVNLYNMKLPNLIPRLPYWYFNSNDKSALEPIFFGCDAVNTPLFIHIPNGFYTGNITMPSDDETSFNDEEVNLLIQNGLAGVSFEKETQDNDDWATCVACAMINHKLMKDDEIKNLPEKCSKCLEKYCVYENPENLKYTVY